MKQHTYCCHRPPADLLLHKTTAEEDVFKNETNGATYCPNDRDTRLVASTALNPKVFLSSTILLQRDEYKYLLFLLFLCITWSLRDKSALAGYFAKYLQEYVTRTCNALVWLLCLSSPTVVPYTICSTQGSMSLLLAYRQQFSWRKSMYEYQLQIEKREAVSVF